MRKLWKDASAGEIKGKSNPIAWFVKESDSFLNTVGNEYFQHLDGKAREEMITNLADLFKKARDNYYNKAGSVLVKKTAEEG